MNADGPRIDEWRDILSYQTIVIYLEAYLINCYILLLKYKRDKSKKVIGLNV